MEVDENVLDNEDYLLRCAVTSWAARRKAMQSFWELKARKLCPHPH
jgi:hypothetical protein